MSVTRSSRGVSWWSWWPKSRWSSLSGSEIPPKTSAKIGCFVVLKISPFFFGPKKERFFQLFPSLPKWSKHLCFGDIWTPLQKGLETACVWGLEYQSSQGMTGRPGIQLVNSHLDFFGLKHRFPFDISNHQTFFRDNGRYRYFLTVIEDVWILGKKKELTHLHKMARMFESKKKITHP